MLTMAPGPDAAPYHDRQIVVLERVVPGLTGSIPMFRRNR